jgi:hypothetical protein
LQHEDGRFCARPAEVWIEITPVMPEGIASAATYLFYDAAYASETPVPVLRLSAGGWPREAAQARIQMWCKSTPSEPAGRLPLEQIANRPPHTAASLPLPGYSDVRFPVRTRMGDDYRVDVVERHTDDSPGTYSLKLELADGPLPRQIVRRFDPAHDLVTHTFVFDQDEARQVAGATLQLTTRAACHRDAWRLNAPLLVDVSGAGDVIQLPTGPRVP